MSIEHLFALMRFTLTSQRDCNRSSYHVVTAVLGKISTQRVKLANWVAMLTVPYVQ